MDRERIFYVYGHRDRSPLKSLFYIGIGKTDRLREKDSRNKYWQNVVAKYGGFDPYIIKDGLTIDEAREMEIALIAKYGRRKYEEGGILVNLAKGGEGNAGFRKTYLMQPVIQFDLKGNKIKEFPYIGSVTDEGFNENQVRWCVNMKKSAKTHKGFLWAKKENAICKGFVGCLIALAKNRNPMTTQARKNCSSSQINAFKTGGRFYKKVVYTNKNTGNTEIFESVRKASEKIGFTEGHVRAVCSGQKNPKNVNYTLKFF